MEAPSELRAPRSAFRIRVSCVRENHGRKVSAGRGSLNLKPRPLRSPYPQTPSQPEPCDHGIGVWRFPCCCRSTDSMKPTERMPRIHAVYAKMTLRPARTLLF